MRAMRDKIVFLYFFYEDTAVFVAVIVALLLLMSVFFWTEFLFWKFAVINENESFVFIGVGERCVCVWVFRQFEKLINYGWMRNYLSNISTDIVIIM